MISDLPLLSSSFPVAIKENHHRETYSSPNKNKYRYFFSVWFSFTNIHDLQDSRGRGWLFLPRPLSLLFYFHLLHRHLDISRAITIESLPLHIASNRSRTGKSLVFEGKSLTTKLCIIKYRYFHLSH